MAAEDYLDAMDVPDDWGEEGFEVDCKRCGEPIFLARDPEDGMTKPYKSEFSDELHSCAKPAASNFFKKL